MRPTHAKLALATAAATMLPAPVAIAPAVTAPAGHAARAAAVRRDLPEPPPADVVRKELGELTVAAPHSMAGYSRAKFPHWITQYGTCDTRAIYTLGLDGYTTSVVHNDLNVPTNLRYVGHKGRCQNALGCYRPSKRGVVTADGL